MGEEKRMIRKGLICAMVVLFVGASVLPSISGNINRNYSLQYVKDIGYEQEEFSKNFGSPSSFFTKNVGQHPEEVLFQTHAPGATVYLCKEKIVSVFTNKSENEPISTPGLRRFNYERAQQEIEINSVVTTFVDANAEVAIKGEKVLSNYNNYFIGNDPAKWYSNVPNYQSVSYQNIYSGIDLTYYYSESFLKYDFIVHPGADPSLIKISYAGMHNLQILDNGDLQITTRLGMFSEKAPIIWQDVDGVQRQIPGRYHVDNTGTLQFEIGEFDSKYSLVIDPALVYSTYLGGSDVNWGTDIAVDDSGCAYVLGSTTSLDFPTVNPYDGTLSGIADVYIAKFSPEGDTLIYSTFLGGSEGDGGECGIDVDQDGNIYVTSGTYSPDFPMINPFDDSLSNTPDVFVAKLSSSGDALLYSTYLGGNGWDWSFGLEVDNSRDVYVTGETASSDFPTVNAFDDTYNGGSDYIEDAFIAKLVPSIGGINSLLYSSYIGGSSDDTSQGIGIDNSGNAYISGFTKSIDFPTKNPYDGEFAGVYNVIVAKFNPTLSGNESLVYSTYLGTSISAGWAITADAVGNAYVTGLTDDYDFPMVNAYDDSINDNYTGDLGDVFVSKFSPSGNTLLYSTFLGGGWFEEARGITVDDLGNISILGSTCSDDFPTKNAYDKTFNGGTNWGDLFVAKINPFLAGEESLIYSTYLGGSLEEVPGEIAVDNSKSVYIAGTTISPDFPMVAPYDDDLSGYPDAVVAKFIEDKSPLKPIISGPSSGKPGRTYTYTFVTSEPDNDSVYYFIDWGDGTNSSWIGPYQSNEEIQVTHKWNKKGTYEIQAKAKDEHGMESDWGTLQVSMPRTISFNSLFLKLLEKFPHAFPILRHLIGL